MVTAMENLKEMVDVNKIIGDAVETPDGHVIIPVSKVTFGFMAGGSEFENSNSPKDSEYPFGGGSGGGVSVQPVAFLIVGGGEIRLLPVEGGTTIERLMDMVPQLTNQVQNLLNKEQKKKERERDRDRESRNSL